MNEGGKCMKWLLVGMLIFISLNSAAVTKRELWKAVLPHEISLRYKGAVIPDKKRTSERVNHTQAPGQNRIKLLKSQKFICLRSSQTETLCSLTENITALPQDIKKFVDEKMLGFVIQFADLTSDPVLKIDTSTEKEWIVDHAIRIGNKVTPRYKLTYLYESKKYFIALPVDSGQPISIMQIHDNQHVSVQMVTNSVVNGQNIGYIFSIVLEK